MNERVAQELNHLVPSLGTEAMRPVAANRVSVAEVQRVLAQELRALCNGSADPSADVQQDGGAGGGARERSGQEWTRVPQGGGDTMAAGGVRGRGRGARGGAIRAVLSNRASSAAASHGRAGGSHAGGALPSQEGAHSGIPGNGLQADPVHGDDAPGPGGHAPKLNASQPDRLDVSNDGSTTSDGRGSQGTKGAASSQEAPEGSSAGSAGGGEVLAPAAAASGVANGPSQAADDERAGEKSGDVAGGVGGVARDGERSVSSGQSSQSPVLSRPVVPLHANAALTASLAAARQAANLPCVKTDGEGENKEGLLGEGDGCPTRHSPVGSGRGEKRGVRGVAFDTSGDGAEEDAADGHAKRRRLSHQFGASEAQGTPDTSAGGHRGVCREEDDMGGESEGGQDGTQESDDPVLAQRSEETPASEKLARSTDPASASSSAEVQCAQPVFETPRSDMSDRVPLSTGGTRDGEGGGLGAGADADLQHGLGSAGLSSTEAQAACTQEPTSQCSCNSSDH